MSKICRENNVWVHLTRIAGILHEYQCTFWWYLAEFFFRTRNLSDKSCSENQNTHFVFNNVFPLCDNVEKCGTAWQSLTTDGNIIQRIRFACSVTEATDPHSEYVILLPLQQWLHERISMLHYTYIACLVWFLFQLSQYDITVRFVSQSRGEKLLCCM
jgi:hypothetical protein